MGHTTHLVLFISAMGTARLRSSESEAGDMKYLPPCKNDIQSGGAYSRLGESSSEHRCSNHFLRGMQRSEILRYFGMKNSG